MGGQSIELRAPGPADRQAWGALWTAYLAFYETTLPEDAQDGAFARLLSGDPTDFQGRLAWLGDRAVGLVHWVFHPHLWRPEGVCYLKDLFTSPDARGTGVARKLIEAVYADADTRPGKPHVYWLTQEDNHAARRLYDRIGTLSPFIRYDRPAS